MRSILLASLLLTALPAFGKDELITDNSQSPESRAAWNITIMKILVGTKRDALDERERRMFDVLSDPKWWQGKDMKPLPEGPDRQRLAEQISRDSLRYDTILSNIPREGSYDKAAMTALTTSQKSLIERYWAIANGSQAPAPPVIPPPGADIKKDPDQEPGSGPGSGPSGNSDGPGGSPGGFNPNTGKGSPNGAAPGGAAPNSDPAKTASDLNKLRGKFSDAMGAAKEGVKSFEPKDDNLAAGPKPAGPQGQPGPQGQTPRQNPSGPENVSPGRFAPGNPSGPAAGTLVAGLPASARPGGYAPSAFSDRTAPSPSPRAGFPSNAPAPETSRAPGAVSAGPGTTSPGVGGPSLGALDPKVPEKKAPPAEEALTEEELAAIKDIQKMLGEASGEAPIDTDALQKGAEKLDRAAMGAAWKGIDIDALSQQIHQVIGMAGVQGTWSQEQIVHQAATNLGLSEVQAGRIIKSLRISEPPFPKLAGMTWWERLLAWARHYKKVFMRRLL